MYRAKHFGVVGSGLAMLFCGANIHAATILNDRFLDGSRANGSHPDEIDTAWYLVDSSSTLTMVTDTSTGPNEGTADSAIEFSNTDNRGFIGEFATQSLGSIGDKITLTFDLRYTTTITSNASGLRFGLYNSNGTPVVADNTVLDNDDFGYRANVHTGRLVGSTIGRESGTHLSAGNGSDQSILGTATVAPPTFGVISHAFLFEITRTGENSASIFLKMDDTSVITVEDSDVVRSDGKDYFSFNEVFFGSGDTNNARYRVDNIRVDALIAPPPPPPQDDVVAIPTPQALYGGLALGTLVVGARTRRRKARADVC